jgi:hypothetical protein
MGGVISFTSDPEEGWLRAGWAFRQVLEDTLASSPGDLEMADAFEMAEALGHLDIAGLEPSLALRVRCSMRAMVNGVLAGEIRSGLLDKRYGDKLTLEQYREALVELLADFPPNKS